MWCHIYMIGIAWIDTVRCRPLSLTCKIGYRTLPGDVKVLARGSRNIWIMIWNIGRFIWFILLSWLQEQRYDQFKLWSNMYSLIIIHDCVIRCSFSCQKYCSKFKRIKYLKYCGSHVSRSEIICWFMCVFVLKLSTVYIVSFQFYVFCRYSLV